MLEIKDGELSGVLSSTLTSPINFKLNARDSLCIYAWEQSLGQALVDTVVGLRPLKKGYFTMDGDLIDAQSVAYFRQKFAFVPRQLDFPLETVDELLDYMLTRFGRILKDLTVFPENMKKNIWLTNGVIFSQRFMLKLIEKGWSREKAYDTVQPQAINAWENHLNFKELMLANPDVTSTLTLEEIEDCFDPMYHVRNVDEIYKRVGIL